MLRCPDLPLLPGTSFPNFAIKNFHKSQNFEKDNGNLLPKFYDTNSNANIHNTSNSHIPVFGLKFPAWLAYDKKVLCFHAHFTEGIQEAYTSYDRTRFVKIYFYLEDETIQISEPRILNSGIPQGCLVSRQRIPKMRFSKSKEFLTILDLNIGKDVKIFDRLYTITGCDMFTKNFLNRLGITVPESCEIISNNIKEKIDDNIELLQSKTVSLKNDKLGQFLEYDRKVLRFFAYWDDRKTKFGDIRDLVLYYFLSDDTIEIKEVFGRNSGRDTGALFLRRGKLPKTFNGMKDFGENDPLVILNVLCDTLKDGRYIPDRLGVGMSITDYYKENDLMIGSVLNVYGREITLIDCDDFTKCFYKKKYGIENFNPLHKPYYSNSFIETNINQRELPPYNGWGSYEDSEGNCKTVEPKPPYPDFKKFINYDGYLLRFGAKMYSKFDEDRERLFAITYYLSDDTISVYEMGLRNSGFTSRYFLKRNNFFLPNQNLFSSKKPKPYTAQHFYVGANILLNDFTFHLVLADEFTLNYMEQNSNEFPLANGEMILNKIRNSIRPIYKEFIAKYLNYLEKIHNNIEVITFDTMKKFLIELLENNITEHEIITICRKYTAIENKNFCNRETIRSAIHMELKKDCWTDIDGFREHIYHIDPYHCPYMNRKLLYSSIKACRIPLDPQLINDIFNVLDHNENNELSINDFISMIDLSIPSAPIPPLNLKKSTCTDNKNLKISFVDWKKFINDLGLEEQLKNQSE